MRELIALYFCTIILMYLSQVYYPLEPQTDRRGETPLRHQTDIFIAAAIFLLCCFYFLRTSYNDTTSYISGFLNADSPAQFIADGRLLDLTGNPLFYFYQSLVRSVTDNYHLFFLPPSILISYSCIKLFKRYSDSPAFSVSIFFAIGTAITLMTAMKQGIATAILLMSIPYALDRKYLRFYLLVALASLFHTYSVVFAIVPLLCGAPWNKRTWILLGLAVFSLLTFDNTLGAFVEYAQSVGAHASEDDVFNETTVNVLRVAVYLIPALLALIFRRRLFRHSSRAENLFTNMSILSGFILMIGLANGANMMGRTAAFFEIGTALCLPWMIKKLFTRESAQLVTAVASVLYFGFFLYEFAISKNFGDSYSAISLWEFIVSLLP